MCRAAFPYIYPNVLKRRELYEKDLPNLRIRMAGAPMPLEAVAPGDQGYFVHAPGKDRMERQHGAHSGGTAPGKGAIGAEKDKRFYRYYPIAEEAECVQAETQSFLNRVFDGSPVKMIAALTGSGSLTEQDCREIEKMLQKMKERE